MKKLLIIPAIIATAFTAAVANGQDEVTVASQATETAIETVKLETTPEVKTDDIFFVGQKEFKISDNGMFEFSNLYGYKKREDAKNKVNGILIGFEIKRTINESESASTISYKSFVKDEFANQSWWINRFVGCDRITATRLNQPVLFNESHKIQYLTGFINDLERLSEAEKASYIAELKMYITAMLDDCDSYDYDNLNFGLDVLIYLSDKKEYSNTGKVALFDVVSMMREFVCVQDEDIKHNKKHARYEVFFRPVHFTDAQVFCTKYFLKIYDIN